MIQEYLTQWIIWYYGDGSYPIELNNKLTPDERIEVVEKTNRIKKILGLPKK